MIDIQISQGAGVMSIKDDSAGIVLWCDQIKYISHIDGGHINLPENWLAV